jgi:UDP-glucose 4-epimerase
MTVLVTGGAGYIGSHTVRLLRERGREVVVLDSLELGHRAAVLDAPLVVGRVDDEPLVEKVVEEFGVDAVIHFAAYKSAGESMHEPEKYFRNNVGGSVGLLEALRRSGVRRFVFSSTAATYGTPETLPVPEGHVLAPESPYGESKLMVERILHWYDNAHDLRSVSLRYFNAAGASRDARIGEDSSVTTNLIPLVMKAALGRLAVLPVFGTDYPTPDGTAIRDYIHVDDLADAHLKALEYLEHDGATTVINVGTGTGSSVQEVIDMARKVSGVDIPVSYVGRRAGDPVAVYADNRKARDVLGWLPDHSLENVVASAWAWHSSHPDGYGSDVGHVPPRLV